MGGSKSSSSSSSSQKTSYNTETNTNNLALDGVDGITVAGENLDVAITDPGAIALAEKVVDYMAIGASEAVMAVSDNTIKGLDKINESNQSEAANIADKAVVIAGIGAAAFAVSKIWGKK